MNTSFFSLGAVCLLVFAISSSIHAKSSRHRDSDEDTEATSLSRKGAHTSSQDDDDEGGESIGKSSGESSTSGSGGPKVKQCQCEELEECRIEPRKQFERCKAKCMANLENPEWDSEEGKRCFDSKALSRSRHCYDHLRKQTCSREANVMIPVRQVMKSHHGRNSQSSGGEDSGGSEKHKHRHSRAHSSASSRRNSFVTMLKTAFGDSGSKAIECVRECLREQHHKTPCMKKLKCGLKRLDPEELREGVAKCRSLKLREQKTLCRCLKRSGIKDLDCD